MAVFCVIMVLFIEVLAKNNMKMRVPSLETRVFAFFRYIYLRVELLDDIVGLPR